MNRSILIAAGLLSVSLLAFARPLVVAGQDHEEHAEHEHEHGDVLESSMESLEDNLRVLRKSLKDETRAEESLTAILAMQAAVSASKLAVPPMAASLEGDARKEFLLAYRLEFVAFGHDLLTLEEHVLKNEKDKAKELYKRIHDREESGHERFSED